MAIEEGFIEYNVEVKGAAQVSAEFKKLADQAIDGAASLEQFERFMQRIEKTSPRMAARLRDTARAIEAQQKALRESWRDQSGPAGDGGSKRFASFEREAQAARELESQLARLRSEDAKLGSSLDRQKARLEDRRATTLSVAQAEAELANAQRKQREAQAKYESSLGGNLSEAGNVRKAADATRGYARAVKDTELANRNLGIATRAAAAEQRKLDMEARKVEGSMIRQRYALYDVSNSLGLVGGALSGIGVYATVVGAQFQSAFANVERTLDPAEFAAGEFAGAVDNIRNSLVQLSGQMPLTFAELSEIATIGNQMGIAEDKLIDFTGTIARFASVSGMSIDEVSKAFGGFMAQTGLAPEYLENLGSSLAYVSIKSNATEPEILAVAREIASLGTGAGLSADQVVGLAGTLAALRVPAERSRGSLETYFQTLRRAVAGGGDDLKNFATVVGVTADELEKMVRSGQGAEILEGFLKNLNAEGAVEVTQALEALNLKQLRVANTFTRMSQNLETFQEHMDYAKSSFIEGAELNRQYEITVETLNSQWQIFINGLNGLVDAISGGAIPSLGALLKMVNGVLFWLIELLQKHRWAAYILAFGAALVTVTGLMLVFRAMVMRGNAALLAYRVAAMQAGAASVGAATSLKGLIRGLLGVEAGGRRAAGALQLFKSALVRTGVGALVIGAGFLADKLLNIGGSADSASLSLDQYKGITEQARKVSQGAGGGVGDLADKLGGKGGGGKPSVKKAADDAAKSIRLLTDYASDLSGVLGRSFSIRFDSQAAMDQVTSKWNKIREEAEKYRQEINKLTADRALKKYWLDQAVLYNDQIRAGQLRAQIADIDVDLAKAQAGASTELKGNTQAAIDNRATMRDLLKGYQDYIEALARSGASQQFIQAETDRLNKEFKAQAAALGYNADELGVYAVAFNDMATIVAGVPRNVDIEFNGNPALQALAEFNAKLEEEARRAAAAAGAGAGEDFGDNFGGGLGDSISDAVGDAFGDMDFGDFTEPAERELSEFEQFMLRFWWNVGHMAIRGIAAMLEPLGGAAAAIKALFSGEDIGEAWSRGIAETGTMVRDQFGAIGFMGAAAMEVEFKRGSKPGEWIADGITYAWDPIKREMSRVGAMSVEEYNSTLKEGVIPGPIIVDNINWAKDSITGEIYRVGTESTRSWNNSLTEGLDPNIVARKVAEGGPLSNQEAKTLAESMGLSYNTVLNDNADPIGKILNKVRDGKGLTAAEAGMLASTDAASYNGSLSKVVSTADILGGKFKTAPTWEAHNAGNRMGSSLWDGISGWLTSIGNWINNLFSAGNRAAQSGGSMGVGGSIRRSGGGGYSGGGYTGPGHWLQPAGIVHAKEYVIPHWGVDQRTKLPKLDYVQGLQRGKRAPRGGSAAAGYAMGGYASGSGTPRSSVVTLDAQSLHTLAGILAGMSPVVTNEVVARANGAQARHATVVGGGGIS